jgi:two-component system chemotaxis response regulator CheY
LKILLIDDSNTMRRIQSNTFKSIGYEDVIQADDGLEPLDQLKSNPDVHLVLMGWKMPNMAGIEALKLI